MTFYLEYPAIWQRCNAKRFNAVTPAFGTAFPPRRTGPPLLHGSTIPFTTFIHQDTSGFSHLSCVIRNRRVRGDDSGKPVPISFPILAAVIENSCISIAPLLGKCRPAKLGFVEMGFRTRYTGLFNILSGNDELTRHSSMLHAASSLVVDFRDSSGKISRCNRVVSEFSPLQ